MNLHTIVTSLQIKEAEPEKRQYEEHQVFKHLDGWSTTSMSLYGQAENVHAIHSFERLFLITPQTNNVHLISALDQCFCLPLDPRFPDGVMRMDNHTMPHRSPTYSLIVPVGLRWAVLNSYQVNHFVILTQLVGEL